MWEPLNLTEGLLNRTRADRKAPFMRHNSTTLFLHGVTSCRKQSIVKLHRAILTHVT